MSERLYSLTDASVVLLGPKQTVHKQYWRSLLVRYRFRGLVEIVCERYCARRVESSTRDAM